MTTACPFDCMGVFVWHCENKFAKHAMRTNKCSKYFWKLSRLKINHLVCYYTDTTCLQLGMKRLPAIPDVLCCPHATSKFVFETSQPILTPISHIHTF